MIICPRCGESNRTYHEESDIITARIGCSHCARIVPAADWDRPLPEDAQASPDLHGELAVKRAAAAAHAADIAAQRKPKGGGA